MDRNSILIDEEVAKQRQRALRGECLMVDFEVLNIWQFPCWNQMIFVSSTYSDNFEERNILFNQILPELRVYGLIHGVDVSFLDMTDECNSSNMHEYQKTWDERVTELLRCHDNSNGIYFLSLQSHKYGNRLLPPFLPQNEFESRFDKGCDPKLKLLANQFYQLDKNSIPPRYLLINPIDQMKKSAMDKYINDLRDSIKNIIFDTTANYCHNQTKINDYYGMKSESFDNIVGSSHYNRCVLENDNNNVQESKSKIQSNNPSVEGFIVDRSLLEWETQFALAFDNIYSSRCCWIYREIINDYNYNLNEFDPLDRVFDTRTPSIKLKYENMINNMRSILSNSIALNSEPNIITKSIYTAMLQNVLDSSQSSIFNFGIPQTQFYLNDWKESVFSLLLHDLKCIIKRKVRWELDGNGVGLEGSYISDILHHYQLCLAKCKYFIGRKELLANAMMYINSNNIISSNSLFNEAVGANLISDNNSTTSHRTKGSYTSDHLNEVSPLTNQSSKTILNFEPDSHLNAISLCIVSPPGSGKSSIMSKLAQLVAEEQAYENRTFRPVIIRFCGSNAASSNSLKLMQSICTQIKFIFKRNDLPKEIPSDFFACKLLFKSLLRDHGVVLFIDSIDSLSDEYHCRSSLSFLSGIPAIHDKTKIIISCTSDEKDPITKKVIHWSGCDSYLKFRRVPRIEILKLDNNSNLNSLDKLDEKYAVLNSVASEVRLIFMSLLENKYNRTVTPGQLKHALSKIWNEPSAFQVYLTVRQVSFWKSTDNIANLPLKESVKSLINQIFDELENDCGDVLARSFIGFLTFSRIGLTLSQLQDLLSIDEPTIDAIFPNNKPTIERIPISIILRIVRSLDDLISYRDNGQLVWNHRVLKEVAIARYNYKKTVIHRILGCYFGNFIKLEVRSKRLILAQPLLLLHPVNDIDEYVWYESCNQYINRSKCAHAAFHLVEGGLISQATAEICNLNNICGYIKCSEGYNLLSCVLKLMKLAQIDDQLDSSVTIRITHFMRLLLDIYASQCIDAQQIFSLCANQPLCSIPRAELNDLFYQIQPNFEFFLNKRLKVHQWNDNCWIRTVVLGGNIHFNAKLLTIKGHVDEIQTVVFSPKGTYLASCSFDKTIRLWNCRTGELTRIIEGIHSFTSISFSPDGLLLASGAMDGSIRLWDTATGELVGKYSTIAGNTVRVIRVRFSQDGQFVTAAYDDKSLLMWNVIRGGNVYQQLEGSLDIINSIDYSQDNKLMVTASKDKFLIVWDTASAKQILRYEGHGASVNSARFSCDGSLIASGSDDMTIIIWSVNNGKKLSKLRGHIAAVTAVAFGSHVGILSSGSVDKTIIIWDTINGRIVRRFDDHTNTVTSICFGENGSLFASASKDSMIIVWDVKEFQAIIQNTNDSSSYDKLSSIRHNKESFDII
eukprot:gene5289-7351_t